MFLINYLLLEVIIKKMYKFSKRSEQRLSECDKDLQLICNTLIQYIDFSIVTGYRSPAEQLKKVEQGLSKVKVSKHNSNPSLAVDIKPYPLLKNDNHSVREQFYYLGGYAMGVAKVLKAQGLITHDVRYGGDWNRDGKITDNGFDDLYHIELI